MISPATSNYRHKWQKTHWLRVRLHKLLWYYRNRKVINLLFSRSTSAEDDEADEWLLEHSKGAKWAEG